MKCTGEKPRCKNCETYNEDCVFVVPARKSAKTSSALLQSLREENRRLREQASLSRELGIDESGPSSRPAKPSSPTRHVDIEEGEDLVMQNDGNDISGKSPSSSVPPLVSTESPSVQQQEQHRPEGSFLAHTHLSASVSSQRLEVQPETPKSTGPSTYHGPTSTLFDEASVDQQSRSWMSKERETYMPKLLIAASAEQK